MISFDTWHLVSLLTFLLPRRRRQRCIQHGRTVPATSLLITPGGGGAGGEGEKPRTQNLIQEILAKKEGVDVTDTDTSSLQGGGAKEVTTASDDDGSSGDDEVSTSSSEDEEAKKKRNE